jgi:hypothetical protein
MERARDQHTDPAGTANGQAAAAASLPRLIDGMDRERLRRYREFLDYYEGRRGGPPARGRERALNFNYARAVVEKGAAYLVTEHRPMVTARGDGDGREGGEGGADRASRASRARVAAAARALDEAWEANDLARLDLETEIDTAVLGDGAYKVVWDEREQRVRVSAPDVQGLFAWWAGDDVRQLWRVASRYELAAEQLAQRLGRSPRVVAGQRARTATVVESWTEAQFELWVDGELAEARPNPYGAIPFVIFPNLPRPKQFWGISDIEPLRESIMELNRALTQLSRILELSGNPVAVLENVEEARDIAVEPGAVWELPEQARAYLLDLLQGGGVRLHVEYVDLVYRTLHDLAETPRIAFGDGGGDRSGIALQLELDPLLRKVGRKRLTRSTALRHRDRLILRVLAHHTGQSFDGVRTDISWGPVFSRDPSTLIAGMQG